MDGLIDVYENVGLFKVDRPGDLQFQIGTTRQLADDAPILFEALRYKGSPGIENGQPVIVEYPEFKELFDASTLGVLQKVDDWSNCMVAGGQVLGCLRGMDPDIEKPADIDIFMYGFDTYEQALARVHKLLTQIYLGYKIANRCNPIDRPSVFIDVVRTDHTLTLIPKYEVEIDDDESVALPKVQIVTRKFSDAAAVLACFDVDCCCVAFDNTKVWANPRAVRALRTGVNIVDLTFRSATFENRLLKYSRRGFAAQDPEMRGDALACLDNYFGGDQGVKETVDLENLVRCIRRSTGLLKLLLADLAGRRGVIWAGVIVDSASFDGENPEHGFEDEYGERAFDPAQGPVVFHPPLLHEPWMAKYEHRQLEALLADWPEQSAKLNVNFSHTGPEINTSRADWERGVYENSFENIEALLKLAPAPATPSPTAKTGLSQGGESSKRPKTERGVEKLGAQQDSPLLALPNLLLSEVLTRCTGESLAAASATCTTLERIIAHGGVWKHACLRDFGPPDPITPTPDVPPQEWGQAYRELRSLAKMGWVEWDVNPMRVMAARRDKSPEAELGYAKNVPLPCHSHATAVFGNKLVLTGGIRNKVGLAGTFVFDFAKKEWAKVPTKLRRRYISGNGSYTVPWELPARRGHTMTAINGREAVILFGKRGLTSAERERVTRAEARQRAQNLNNPDDIRGIHAGWAGANEELDAIWAAEPFNGLCADAYVLDVATWTYEKLEAAGVPPAPRQGHSAVLRPGTESLVVFGGALSAQERADTDSDEGCVSTAGLHVLARECEHGERVWVWREVEATGDAPHAQHGHGACVVGDRMVLLGGHQDNEKVDNERIKVWFLDMKAMHWSQPPPDASSRPPQLRVYCGSPTIVGDNVILVVGGVRVVYFNLRDSRWRFKDFNSELRVPSFDDEEHKVTHSRAPVSRAGHTTARFGFSIYMVGGDLRSRNVYEYMPVLDLLGYDCTPRA